MVVGMRHPLAHVRGRSIAALRSAGVLVDVLGECLPGGASSSSSSPGGVDLGVILPGGTSSSSSSGEASDPALASAERSAIDACLRVNEALLHRAALRRPLSILKCARGGYGIGREGEGDMALAGRDG